VLEAYDGWEGLAALQVHPIDLVITDILMLEQESFETLQQLRPLTPSPKIIALAGGGQTGRLELLQVTTGGGTNRMLRKPMRSHDLCAAVQELLTGQGYLATAPGICPYTVFSPLQRAYGPIRSQ